MIPTAGAWPQEPPANVEPRQREEELRQRLIRKAATNDQPESLMEKIMRLMGDASQRLERQFDAGRQTQEMQEKIMAHLDEAIKLAASQRRPKSRASSSGESDKRESTKGGRPRPANKGEQATSDQNQPNDPAATGTGKSIDSGRSPDSFQEARRTWGNLPARDRDEILQGLQEESLDRHRSWIERYFQTLQESDE